LAGPDCGGAGLAACGEAGLAACGEAGLAWRVRLDAVGGVEEDARGEDA